MNLVNILNSGDDKIKLGLWIYDSFLITTRTILYSIQYYNVYTIFKLLKLKIKKIKLKRVSMKCLCILKIRKYLENINIHFW